jgi:hypothetical protein
MKTLNLITLILMVCVALHVTPSVAVAQQSCTYSCSGYLTASDPQESDGTYYDDYTIVGRAGQQVCITMRSRDFDAYLYIGEGLGTNFSNLEQNDDGGEGHNAALSFTFPRNGTFTIRANSLSRSTGAYDISISSGECPDEN